MKHFTLISFITLLAIVFYGNANAQIFKPALQVSLLNAPAKELENVKKIAILDFGTVASATSKEAGADLGSKMADYLTSDLLVDYRGRSGRCYIDSARTDIYTIVERAQLTKILEEQKLSTSDLVSEDQAVSVGKLLGADAVVLGNISYDYKDERSKSEVKDKEGRITIYHTLKRTTMTEARMKIILVSTGEVIGQTSASKSLYSDATTKSTPPAETAVTSAAKLAEEAARTISGVLANYFSPYYSPYTFTFEKVKNDELQERAKDANEFIRLGEIDKAYEMFNAIYSVDQYNAQLLFNMAVLEEVGGNYEKAQKLYASAVNVDPDNKAIVEGMNRCKRNILLASRLNDLGIKMITHQYPEGFNEKSLAEKVKIKGNRGDRRNVYEVDNENGKVIAQLPGGLELKVEEKSEKWVKVMLPSGEIGFMSLKDVIDGK